MRTLLSTPLVAALALGCVKAPDPFLERRNALAAVDARVPGADWKPQLGVYLSDQAVDAIARMALNQAVGKGPIESDFSGVSTKTSLGPPDLTLRSRPDCGNCLAVTGRITGNTQASPGGLSLTFGWAADATGSLVVGTVDSAEGRKIRLALENADAWDVDVSLDGVPAIFAGMLSGVIGSQVESAIQSVGLVQGVDVGALPADGPIRLRDIRVRADGGVQLEGLFSVLESGVMPRLPRPDRGWVAVLPAETARGILNSALLRQDLNNGYGLDIRSLTFIEGGFRVKLRLVKRSNREKWREFLVNGVIDLDSFGVLRIQTTDVTKTAGVGRLPGLTGAFVSGYLQRQINNASVTIDPRALLEPVRDTGLEVELTQVVADSDVLIVFGTADVPGS